MYGNRSLIFEVITFHFLANRQPQHYDININLLMTKNRRYSFSMCRKKICREKQESCIKKKHIKEYISANLSKSFCSFCFVVIETRGNITWKRVIKTWHHHNNLDNKQAVTPLGFRDCNLHFLVRPTEHNGIYI